MLKRKIFQPPWGYLEGCIIVTGLIILSLLIEISTKFKPISLPSWPYNIQLAISFITLLIIVHYFYKHSLIVRWLSSIPSSISAIVFFALLALAIGLIPQTENPDETGLSLNFGHLQRSWFFVTASLYLLTCLGLVILSVCCLLVSVISVFC